MTTETTNPLAEKAAAYLADPALLGAGMGWLWEYHPDLSVGSVVQRGEPISEERVRIALGLLLECKPGQRKHDAYELRYKFEWWAGRHVTTGDVVAACLLVGVPADTPRNLSESAWVYLLAPKDCKGSCRNNRVPAGDRRLLCDWCRSLSGRR